MENKNSIHNTSVHNCIRIVYLLQALTCVAFKTRHMTYMLKRKKLLVAAALLSIMKDLNYDSFFGIVQAPSFLPEFIS